MTQAMLICNPRSSCRRPAAGQRNRRRACRGGVAQGCFRRLVRPQAREEDHVRFLCAVGDASRLAFHALEHFYSTLARYSSNESNTGQREEQSRIDYATGCLALSLACRRDPAVREQLGVAVAGIRTRLFALESVTRYVLTLRRLLRIAVSATERAACGPGSYHPCLLNSVAER